MGWDPSSHELNNHDTTSLPIQLLGRSYFPFMNLVLPFFTLRLNFRLFETHPSPLGRQYIYWTLGEATPGLVPPSSGGSRTI